METDVGDEGDEVVHQKRGEDERRPKAAWADFMSSYVSKSMRIKSDKWQKLIGTEEYRVSLNRFIDSA